MSTAPVRVLALWSPDWPVTAAARAAHVPPQQPAAVIVANRVLVCSAVARAHGIRRGLRRREAQARCPELAVLTRDPDRDARAFEPVVAAVEELAPGVEIVRPGLVALAAQGPAGYFGGELPAAERLVDQVAARTGVECQVGLADGLFAAVLAARRGLAVAPGDTPAFLAPLGVEELDREPDVDRSELVGLLRRLGLRSLGAFAALDAEDVASRFGADAVAGHRLARGLDPRPPVRRRPPEELLVEIELDPPVDRVDAAAFATRGLAMRLHHTLAGHGLSCTRLGVAARTTAGEELYRVWRCAEPLTPAGTVDRVRWQLDAWITGHARSRAATAGAAALPDGRPADGRSADECSADGRSADGPGAVVRLRLVPEETVPAGALQLGLWGEIGETDERAGRALVRVQALLGPESVLTAVVTGGRDPAEQVRLVPWGDEREGGVSPGREREGGVSPGREPAGGVSAGGVPVPTARSGVSRGTGGAGRGGGPARGGRDRADPVIDGSGRSTAPGAAERPEPVTSGSELTGGRLVAPAGWPEDVVRRTGRISAAEVFGRALIGGSGPSTGREAAQRPEPAITRSNGDEPSNRQPSSRQPSSRQPTSRQPTSRQPTSSQPTSSKQAAGGSVEGRSTNRRRRPPARRSTPTPVAPEGPAPWPGRLPAPAPATVPPEPLPAELVDVAGRPVLLTAPDLLSAPPQHLVIDGGDPRTVGGWAGPWPLQQRWWTPDAVESSRLQVLCPDGPAVLLLARDGRWWVTGIYD